MTRPSHTLACTTLAEGREMALAAVEANHLDTLSRLSVPGTSSWVELATGEAWWEAATGRRSIPDTLDHLARKGAFRGVISSDAVEAGLRRLAGFGRAASLGWALYRPFVHNGLSAQGWGNTLWAALHAATPAVLVGLLRTTTFNQVSPSVRFEASARALVNAARRGLPEGAKALLDSGLHVDTLFGGYTALHAAMDAGGPEASPDVWWRAENVAWRTVWMLLEAGASIHIPDAHGVSALDRASAILGSRPLETVHVKARLFWGPQANAAFLDKSLPLGRVSDRERL